MLKFTKLLSPYTQHRIISQQIFRFCTGENQLKQKSYIMPQPVKQKRVEYSDKHVTFKNGRYLIYMNKQNLATPFLLGLHFTIPLIYIAYLIATNPFYLTFPAALPLMFMIEGALFMWWINHKAHHKRQIERIYLLSNFLQFEIVYANKIRRYVKNNPQHTFHYIAFFEDIYKEDYQNNRIVRYKGTRFPPNPDTPLSEAPKPSLLDYGWTVRDRDFNVYLLPAKFQYADWDVLSKVLNGVPVIFKNYTQQGEFDEDKFPTIQQQEENLKKLKEGKQEEAKDSKN